MKNKKSPFVSIIISTYNGSKKIGETIEALLNQNYSKSKYEIIVVNDGSTDTTSDIVSKYSVKLINHTKNLGRYSARNTGLKHAKGEIVAYVDDDCIVDKNWLGELLKGYKNKDVMGVGGIVKPYYFDTLMDKYVGELGYGNPIPIKLVSTKSIVRRFFLYLKNMINPIQNNKDNFQVSEIYANASFLKSILERAGKWDESFKFRGDSEMCCRLNDLFPNKKLLLNKKAILFHKHKSMNLLKMINDYFIRSRYTYDIYIKRNKTPHIFPFPLIIIFFSVILGIFNIFLLPFSLIFLPQILYFWWPIRFIKKLKLYYLVFPYIQLSLEFSTILGMLRGYIILNRKHNKN